MTYSGLKQFRAHFSKNHLEKRRNIRITICEFLSHLVIVYLLVLGYNLSKIVKFPETEYTTIHLNVPPPFFDGDPPRLRAANAVKYIDQIAQEPLSIPTLSTFVSIGNTLRDSAGGATDLTSIFRLTQLGRSFDNFLLRGQLMVCPDGALADSFLAYLNSTVPSFFNDGGESRVKVYPSEEEAVNFVQENPESYVFALLVLHQITPFKVNYEIRMPYYMLPNTNRVILRSGGVGLSSRYRQYVYSGFLSLQDEVDKWAFEYTGAVPLLNTTNSAPYNPNDIFDAQNFAASAGGGSLSRQTNPQCVKPVAFVMPFPVPEYDTNPFFGRVGYLLGLGLVMATMYPVSRLVKCIVEEKESRQREVMKIMGLVDWAHQLSWFATGFVLFFWIGLSTFYVTTRSFIPKSNKFLIFLYFVLFSLSEASFGLFLSVFMSNSKTAGIVAPVALFVCILPRYIFFQTNEDELASEKVFASLLSPTAFTFGADAIASYELGQIGIQWDNYTDGNFSFADSLRMMLLDFFLYGLLAFYFDKVLPQEHGVPLHPLFFLDRAYWRGGVPVAMLLPPPSSGIEKSSPSALSAADADADAENAGSSESSGGIMSIARGMKEFQPTAAAEAGKTDVERIPLSELPRAQVCLQGLRKRYPDGKLAVRNMSLTLLEGDITVLLGANGAGKTTSIGMVTGLIDITGGDVNIYGHSVKTDMQTIRQMTGVCPQHNVLFPTMTVAEHLDLFGRIKGLEGEPLASAVTKAVTDVGLVEKRDAPAASLSGGMKRKLSLAIALMGDPKFVLLDEPTSGMDPYSRRSTWELLMRFKVGRVVLLTTHFMEEADTLGDRVAIMSEGRLRCSGSSLFLKTRYGAGYVLSMARTKQAALAISKGLDVSEALGVGKGAGAGADIGGTEYNNKAETSAAGAEAGGHDSSPKENAALALAPRVNLRSQGIVSLKYDAQVIAVEALVRTVVPEAKAVSAVAGEILFQLPLTATHSFGKLFLSLKEKAGRLGVGGYGISITTLEQVFIRLALEAKAKSFARLLRKQKRQSDAVSELLTDTLAPGGLLAGAGASVDDRAKVLDEAVASQFQDMESAGGAESDESDDEDEEDSKVVCKCADALKQSVLIATRRLLRGDHIKDDGDAANSEGIASANTQDSGDYLKQVSTAASYSPASSPKRSPNRRQVSDLGSLSGSGSKHPAVDALRGESSEEVGVEMVQSRLDANVSAAPPPHLRSTSNTTERSANDAMKRVGEVDVRKIVELELAGSATMASGVGRDGDSAETLVVNSQSPLSSTAAHATTLSQKLASKDSNGCWSFYDRLVGKRAASKEKEPAAWGLAADDGVSRGSVVVQFKELMRKRFIIAKRDLKGFFFQILFPTLQIFLILSVLTLTYSPAGKTLKLQSKLIENVLKTTPPGVALALTGEDWVQTALQDTDTMVQIEPPRSVAKTSAELSRYLLDVSYMSRKDFPYPARYGGYVLNDTVKVNLTVSWPWVRRNVDFVIENRAIIAAAGSAFGLDIAGASGDLVSGAMSVPFTLPNASISALNFTSLIDAGNNAFNFTSIQLNLLRNVTNAIKTSGVNNTDELSGVLSAKRIEYDFNSTVVTFVDAELYIEPPVNITTNLGNVSVPLRTVLLQVLPNATAEYNIFLPSAFSILHNTTCPHAIGIYNAELVSAAFATCSPIGVYESGGGGASSIPRPQYLVKNHPLPVSIKQALETKIVLAVLSSLFILVPLCYIPSSFIPFIVKERVAKSKHLQIVSGVSPYTYWIATYMWDMALFTVLSLFTIAAFAAYEGPDGIFTSNWESTQAVFFMIWTYGFASIPLSYLYSLAFENHSTAQISITTINFITGFVGTLAILILEAIEETAEIAATLQKIFRIFPPYLIGEGFIKLAGAFFVNFLSPNRRVSYFAWSVCGRSIAYMAYEAAGYMGIILLLEMPWVRNLLFYAAKARAVVAGRALREAEKAVVLDDDVLDERKLLLTEDPKDYALFVRGLEKVYPPGFFCSQTKYAVRNVSFACPNGERFGLLGINGAGKTTTLGVLTGECFATSGDVFVGGYPLSDPRTKTLIGYCPQVDPLLEAMNSYETLWFFGRIRGIPKAVLSVRVQQLIDQVGLTKHAKRQCGSYSGGNKRKLSLAVAMIGEPKVLLLDEPSTGMDPEARRSMWEVIESVSANRSIVLVSHSMEECEALCTRMAIMVSGKIKCLGSTQHIKSKFGAEYQIEIRCSSPQHVASVIALLQETLSHSSVTVDEQHGGFVRMKTGGNIDLAQTFDLIESNKQALGILNYSVSQATLEQIFIGLARDQEEEAQAAGFHDKATDDPLLKRESGA